jgi:hypothetical protein
MTIVVAPRFQLQEARARTEAMKENANQMLGKTPAPMPTLSMRVWIGVASDFTPIEFGDVTAVLH